MIGLTKDFSGRPGESDERQTTPPLELEAFQRARRVQDALKDILALKTGGPAFLVEQAAMIYRLQQDIYQLFGINLAKPETFFTSHEGIAVYGKAFEAVEHKSHELHQYWIEQKNQNNATGTAYGGLMTFACEFWVTTLAAPGSSFIPLKMCVQYNNLVVASAPKDKVIEEASKLRDLFFKTGDYSFEESQWPYIDFGGVSDEYREALKSDRLLGDQFLMALNEPPVDPILDAHGRHRSAQGQEAQFSVVQVSEDLRGRPMLHIEPAPLNRDGIPELSEGLARTIAPHLCDADNIAIRYVDCGLPTTVTAIVSTYEVSDQGLAVTYILRIMLFGTQTGKIGSNIHLRPARRRVILSSGAPLSHDIVDARTYEFREAYDSYEQSQNDLERLAKIAHRHFLRQ